MSSNLVFVGVGLGLVGIVIGLAIPYLVGFINFAVRSPFRRDLLLGTWHAYHFTLIRGESILRYEHWTINRNLLNRLVITTDDPERPNLKYKGTISVERNYLLVQLRGAIYPEEVQMRFFDIIPTGQDIAFGLAMGIDFDHRPQCVVRMMSRKELTEEDARGMLLSKTTIGEQGTLGILQ